MFTAFLSEHRNLYFILTFILKNYFIHNETMQYSIHILIKLRYTKRDDHMITPPIPVIIIKSYFTSQTSPFIKKSFSLRVGFFACTSSIC